VKSPLLASEAEIILAGAFILNVLKLSPYPLKEAL